MFIYKITNPQGLVYIGKTNNTENRFNQYKYPSKDINTLLYQSLHQYGFENHKVEILEETQEKFGRAKETSYISLYNSFESGLNMNAGGGGVDSHTPEAKLKIKESKVGWKPSKERGILIGNKIKGKPRSKETKQKIAEALKGTTKPFKGRVSPNKGNKYSDEVREGISKNRKGHKMSIETKQLMSKSQWKAYKISQYTKDGEFIKIWDSITQAQKAIGGDIGSCVRGNQKTAGGFVWRKSYVD